MPMFRKHAIEPPMSEVERVEKEYVLAKEQYRRSKSPRDKEKFVAARDRVIEARNFDRQYRQAVQAGERKP